MLHALQLGSNKNGRNPQRGRRIPLPAVSASSAIRHHIHVVLTATIGLWPACLDCVCEEHDRFAFIDHLPCKMLLNGLGCKKKRAVRCAKISSGRRRKRGEAKGSRGSLTSDPRQPHFLPPPPFSRFTHHDQVLLGCRVSELVVLTVATQGAQAEYVKVDLRHVHALPGAHHALAPLVGTRRRGRQHCIDKVLVDLADVRVVGLSGGEDSVGDGDGREGLR